MTKYTKFTAVEAGEFKGKVVGTVDGDATTKDLPASISGSYTKAEIEAISAAVAELQANWDALVGSGS